MTFDKNRLTNVIVVFLVLCIVLSCACKNSNQKTTDSASLLFPYYSTENDLISISHEIDAGFSGDDLFVQTYYESEEYWEAYRACCVPKVDDEEGQHYPLLPINAEGDVITPENQLLILNDVGATIKTYDLNKECGTSITSRKMSCSDNGCWVLSLKVDVQTDEMWFCLDLFHPMDGVTKHVNLDVSPAQVSVLDFFVCEDGRIALTCWSDKPALLLFDSNGSYEKTIELPESIESNVVFFQDQWTCVGGGDEGTVLFCFDEKNANWSETKLATPLRRNIIVRGENLFGTDNRGIVLLDVSAPMSLSWEDVSVWGTVQDIRFLNEGEMQLVVRPLSEELLVRYHLRPAEKQSQKNKKEFVIAGYDLENSCVNQLVQDMSLRHPEIKFVMRDYKDEVNATEENWSQVKTEINRIMSLDLANGTAPDMYFDNLDDMGMEDLGRLGYLRDLTPLISTLDEEEYFIDKITMGEETPYCVCLYYDVIGFCASEDYVDNPYEWTYDDFYRSADKFSDYSCVQTIFSKQYLLKHAVMAQIDKFIQNGKANFTGEDFLYVLKWTNDIGCRSNWDEYVPAELKDGLYMLDWADVVSLGSVIMYQDYVIVGFPNENGSLHVVPYGVLAVSATTDQTELANEILNYALGESFQSENYQLQGGISVNRGCFEKRMEQDYDLFFKANPQNLRYSREEYYDMYRSVVSRGNRYLHGCQAIINICLEEAQAYYTGDSSAEHVAEIIQNRVELYLQETSS